MDELRAAQVARFLELHGSWAPREHAEFLASNAKVGGVIPFCWSCGDWHDLKLGHSSTDRDL